MTPPDSAVQASHDQRLHWNLAALVAEQAQLTPDAVALVADDEVRYDELARMAAMARRSIRDLGLPAETPIGVLMRRDAPLVAALLGVLGAGCAYVPLDPNDPPERWRRMIAAADCPVVLGDPSLTSRLAPDTCPIARFVDIRSAMTAAASETISAADDVPIAPGDARLAYVLFTSGSTGAPKGVEVEHRSVVNLLFAARDLLHFAADDRYLAVSTIGFDISVAELFLPLVTGGSLVLRDRSLLLQPDALAADIERHGVTVFQTGPSVWSTILDARPAFPRLRVAISTGEAVAPSMAARISAVADESWNLYGPTEATVWATGHRLRPSGDIHDTAISTGISTGIATGISAPIGRALAGVTVSVRDERGEPVAGGLEGELWLGGVAVARGYRGHDALTAERFLRRDGGRFYRTGDRVCMGPDGALEYLGRSDDQMKIHGVRIEPREIESALQRLPGVQRAAATWYEGPTGGRVVVAAIVESSPGGAPIGAALHEALSRVLPWTMIPTRIVVVPSLPMTASGKVDRTAIRLLASAATEWPADDGSEMESPGAPSPPAFAPPTGKVTGTEALTETATATEQKLIAIWERVLRVHGLRPTDHFFSVGGDSLAAVTMMLDIEEAFGVPVPVHAIFASPTVAALALVVDQATRHEPAIDDSAYIFPLVADGHGHPMFFNSIDLKMARRGVWQVGCPLFAVSHWAQGSGFSKARSVESLARIHVEGIRQIQPHGPYRVGGYSFGGLLALEIAQQLRGAGERIELLFLLDPMEPPTSELRDQYRPPKFQPDLSPFGGTETTLRARLLRHARAMPHSPRAALTYLARRRVGVGIMMMNLGGRVPAWQWLNYRLVHFHGRRPNAISAALLPSDRWPAFWYTSARLAKHYVARAYHGPVLAILPSTDDRRDVWRELLGPDAQIELSDTAHVEVFDEPALKSWMDLLRSRLAGRANPGQGATLT